MVHTNNSSPTNRCSAFSCVDHTTSAFDHTTPASMQMICSSFEYRTYKIRSGQCARKRPNIAFDDTKVCTCIYRDRQVLTELVIFFLWSAIHEQVAPFPQTFVCNRVLSPPTAEQPRLPKLQGAPSITYSFESLLDQECHHS